MLGKHCACFILFFVGILHAQTSLGNAVVVRSVGAVAFCSRESGFPEDQSSGLVSGWKILTWDFFPLLVYPFGHPVMNKPSVLSVLVTLLGQAATVAGRAKSCSWEPACGLAAVSPQLPEFSCVGGDVGRESPS